MATRPTVVTSDPSIRSRSSGSGTYSSAAAARTSTVVKPRLGSSLQSAPTIVPPPPPPAPHVDIPTVVIRKPFLTTPTMVNDLFNHSYSVTVAMVETNNVGGNPGDVQFNDGDRAFGGDAGFTYNPTRDALTVGSVNTDHLNYANGETWVSTYGNSNVADFLPTYSGNLNATYAAIAGVANEVAGANVTGTVSLATSSNVVSASAQPAITSVGTLTTLGVTGNAAVGGVLTDNLYYANGMPWIHAVLGVMVDSFIGTGAQTDFVLNMAPVSVNHTNVFIHGVYQQKPTYTVTGTTLSFSQAPPAPEAGVLNNIEVMTYHL